MAINRQRRIYLEHPETPRKPPLTLLRCMGETETILKPETKTEGGQ
jgi:hypothetical protein